MDSNGNGYRPRHDSSEPGGDDGATEPSPVRRPLPGYSSLGAIARTDGRGIPPYPSPPASPSAEPPPYDTSYPGEPHQQPYELRPHPFVGFPPGSLPYPASPAYEQSQYEQSQYGQGQYEQGQYGPGYPSGAYPLQEYQQAPYQEPSSAQPGYQQPGSARPGSRPDGYQTGYQPYVPPAGSRAHLPEPDPYGPAPFGGTGNHDRAGQAGYSGLSQTHAGQTHAGQAHAGQTHAGQAQTGQFDLRPFGPPATADTGFGPVTGYGPGYDEPSRYPSSGMDAHPGRRTPIGLDRPSAPPTRTRRERREAESEERRHMPLWQELPLLLVVAFCLAVLIRSFLLQAFSIPSSSMEQTLLVGDRVLVNKVIYDLRNPRRGEIVVFQGTNNWVPENLSQPAGSVFERIGHTLGDLVGVSRPGEKDFIKRIIGLPGDRVACCDEQGRVTVNGQGIDEPYINVNSSLDVPPAAHTCGSRRFEEVVVPPGQIFVMGDNRIVSQDSRCQGPVPIENIIGKAFLIVWPSDRWGGLGAPESLASPQHVGAAAVTLPILATLVGSARRGRKRRR